MFSFWRTKNGLCRLLRALTRFKALATEDLRENLRRLKHRFNAENRKGLVGATALRKDIGSATVNFESLNRPVIFISACVNADYPGGWKYNGGIKEYNYLVKLLRSKGYEAYVVTYDGAYQEWLIEHQAHISLDEFKSIKQKNNNVRCVTSWAIAKSYIEECSKLYFWDMELLYTEHEHFGALARLYDDKIVKSAAISRTVQAWHMANFEVPCSVIPNLLDTSYWNADENKRIFQRVGYMNEGEHTEQYIDYLKDFTLKNGLTLEFFRIYGNESDVLNGMQTCNLFVSMNLGKDELWGEGCPRTVIEALSTGAVLLAFDIIGNRETLIHNYNSFIVPRYRIDLLAEKLTELYSNPDLIDSMRANSLHLLHACHTLDSRWPVVKEFLDLYN